MALPYRLRARGILSRLATPPRLPGVLSATEFEIEFDRERARVDRYSGCFSLVVFAPIDSGPARLSELARILVERIRVPDLVGCLDHAKLAILLPQTSANGAWKCTEDLISRISKAGLKANCIVYVYPMDELGLNVKPQDKSGTGDGPDGGSMIGPRRTGSGVYAKDEVASMPGIYPDLSMAELRQCAGGYPVRDLGELLVEPLPWWKRTMDVVASATLLLLLSPLLLLTALAIKLTSRGPVFFRQQRAGLGGKPFTFYKFRSMYTGAEEMKASLLDENEQDGPIFKIREDPRMTPIGRLMRKTSIDELPQLWNVLKGDMSLVGPRPPTLDEVPSYQRWQRRRLTLTGGLTCIWQVNGRSEIGFEDWMRMDVRYAQRRSLLEDLKLLSRTLGAVLSGRGAY